MVLIVVLEQIQEQYLFAYIEDAAAADVEQKCAPSVVELDVAIAARVDW